MEELELKVKRGGGAYKKVIILALIFLLFILGRGTLNMFEKNKEAKKNLEDTQKNLEVLVDRKENLEKEISRLSTERGIDDEIRTKFQVTKEGEKMIVLVNSPESTTTEVVEEKESFWQMIWPF